ncbi:MAG TPA: DUF3352 domain-containing protein [Solirubrobacteraceae bacterium]|nr:DUF3352 domain-containing protein [Solirubrobacteraceae bacterium]
MPRAVRLALISLSIVVAGCGGSSASGGDDPARAVPASAGIYADATLRPEGSLREDALAAAGKVLRTSDPEGKIRELVDKAFAESEDPELDWEKDVAPWLGEKVAVWVAPASGEEDFRGAVVAMTKDEEAAQAAIERAVKGSDKTFSTRTYKDVSYQASSDSAAGIVEGFAVFGTEPEFKKTVDAAKGGGLASEDRFEKAMDGLEDDRLGSFYVDVRALVDAAARQEPDSAEQIEQFERFVPIDKIGPVAGAFVANGDRLAVDAVASVPEGALPGGLGALTGGGSTPLLGELPGDSWVALGAPDVGQSVRAIYQQAAGALGGAAIEGQLRHQLGLDLQEDVFSWIGDVAFFARGTTLDTIEGGVVIEVTDSDKAKAAFPKLIGLAQSQGDVPARPVKVDGAETAFEAAAPRTPKPVVAARSEDRVVIALGREAAAAALGDGARLADSDTYGAAKSVLGDGVEPGLVFSMPAALELARGLGSTDADFKEAEPYLEAFGVIAGGSGRDGDTARSRFAAELK